MTQVSTDTEATETEVIGGPPEYTESFSAPRAAPSVDVLPIPKIRDVVRIWVLYAMHISHGNKPAVAKALGISLKSVYNHLARYRREGYLP